MNYYIMQSEIGASKSELIKWEKTLKDAITYAQWQIELWHEIGANPPRYTVHHTGMRGEILWSNF